MTQESSKPDYAQLMKAALLELKGLRASLDELKRAQTEPIAIVGMGCRLPGGVDSPQAFWHLLHGGVDAIGEVPKARWDAAAYYDPNPDAPGKIATRSGGFLRDIDMFDPGFFGISPREARSLDPQQRLLLEVAWEALEMAGQSPGQLYGSATGVYIGMSTFDYALHQVGGRVEEEDLHRIDGYVATGSTLSPAAGRLSYVLGLKGPSMVVDTACSSSLVATHLAVTSLRGRECDMALAGGVNLILRPEWNVNFTKAHMLAPDGRCKTFDASADGYSRGEGCGIVVLQRLSDAIAAGRNMLAVIRGTAVNQDGASGGLTVPNGPSQEAVVRRALDAAGVRPEQISYVEAHGTGTSLGDPIEVAALGAVFGTGRSKDTPLRIGSVKTNVGHLEAAAGVAGLMKVALSLKHEEIPPHLHFRNRNPLIDWDGLPVAVPVTPTPWPSGGEPRRAGLSSFGFTGTNAHVVLEEAPRGTAAGAAATAEGETAERPLHVLAISARTGAALQELAGRYEHHLTERPHLELPNVAFTANTGRSHFRHRLAVVADSLETAHRKLADHGAGKAPEGVLTGEGSDRPKLAFLFTGQGSQYTGMGRQLYETQSLFRATIDRCEEILRPQLERSLLDVLYPPAGQPSPLDDTAYTQPALFALEYALAALWRSWGIEPDAVMGHSVGEYAAACVAGAFSLEAGLTLIAARARLMQALSQAGQMAAVQTTPDRAAAAIAAFSTDISLAAINGPNSVVISGAARAVSEVVASLQAEGIPTQALRVSHAFHSPLMEPMLAEFERAARGVGFASPARDLVSNLTGRVARAEIATPEYWVRHVTQPVRFAEGMETLYERGCRVFVEIGPASTLLAMGRVSLGDRAAAWLLSLRAGGDWNRMLQSLAELYARGASVDWAGFDRDYARRRVELPTYPFQRQRYWVDIDRRGRAEARPVHAVAHVEASPGLAPRTVTPAVGDLLYEIEWSPQPRPPGDAATRADGQWIILADQGQVGKELASRLEKLGARCALAWAGSRFTPLEDGHFRVDPANPGDLQQLWTTVSARGAVRGVVHLWSLDMPPTPDVDLEKLDRCDALESTLHMVRAAARSDSGAAPAIWCVTRGGVAAGGAASDVLSVAQAPLWGFGRVVSLEHPGVWGGLLDLSPNASVPRDAQVLVRELLSPDGEDQIAFRGDARYVPRLVRRSHPSAGEISLDRDGAYLVMGGLGALGLHAARWLVSKGARTLVLASRRGLDTPGAEKAVRDLEALGAGRVIVARADASRADDVEGVLAEIAAGAAPLRGVIHAAGVDAPVPLVDMTADNLRAMLGSKVRGGWILHEKTRALDLDLFVCFSSVSSVWGSPGRAHYAAANAFLDALAQERRRSGLRALSINWGPWLGGGMGREDELRQLERLGNRGLEPATALRALDVLVAGGDVQATAADVDWPRFRAGFEARRRRPLLAKLEAWVVAEPPQAGSATAVWIEQLQRVPAGERATLLEELLRSEVADALGFSGAQDVPVDRSVFEMGMDSLRAVELATRLQHRLGLERPIQFFDCPQVTALAARLLEVIVLADQGAASVSAAPNAAKQNQPLSRPAHSKPAGPAAATRAEGNGITCYTRERETEIFEFSRVAWPSRPDDLIESRWRWMFVESAERLGRQPRVWLYRDSGKVVAHHGAISVQLQAGDDVMDSAWFADTMVLASHRSTATGARLMIESNEEFAVGLSLGQTEQMRKIALRLGWAQVAPLRTFVLLLRPRCVLGDKLNPLTAAVAGIGLSGLQYLKRLLSGAAGEQLNVRQLDRFDATHDHLWSSVSSEYGCAVTRDSSYLNWKYVTQPGQDFVRLEFARAEDVVAIAVLAVDDPGAIYGYRRALVLDLVVSPNDAPLVLGVLESIRRQCAALDVDALFFHLINGQLERYVQAFGFMQRAPTRFLLVNPQRTSDAARQRLLSPESWLITMGDSDIDRPWETDGDRLQVRTTRRAPPSLQALPTSQDASVV